MFLQLTAEEKQAIMNEIKRFYLEERGEEIGDIAAIQTFEFWLLPSRSYLDLCSGFRLDITQTNLGRESLL